ncbi:MAG: nuclease [Bradyrhizobium sp.]|nr:nuclease [Bradyrhizobium sp.]
MGDPTTAAAERVLALKYVLHFVGDLHQPLHMADNHDRGGNCVPMSLGQPRTVSLHGYWDSVVVGELGRDARVILARLTGEITPGLASQWLQGDFASWGMEANAVAVSVAYSFRTPPRCESHMAPLDLPKGYDARAQAAVATQLERAGVRLAIVLERALRLLSLAAVSNPTTRAPQRDAQLNGSGRRRARRAALRILAVKAAPDGLWLGRRARNELTVRIAARDSFRQGNGRRGEQRDGTSGDDEAA